MFAVFTGGQFTANYKLEIVEIAERHRSKKRLY